MLGAWDRPENPARPKGTASARQNVVAVGDKGVDGTFGSINRSLRLGAGEPGDDDIALGHRSQGDTIIGDIYSGGNFKLSQNASVSGQVRAKGTVSGTSGAGSAIASDAGTQPPNGAINRQERPRGSR